MDHVLLDRDTLRVVLAVVELTVAPIVAMIWMRNRDVRGVHWWIGTSVFTTIGFSVPILFPPDGVGCALRQRLLRDHGAGPHAAGHAGP